MKPRSILPLILALVILTGGCAGTKQTYISETYATIASVAEVVNATMGALDDLYTEGVISQDVADTAAQIHSKYRATHIALSITLEHYAKLPREEQGLAPIGTQELLSRLLGLSADLQALLATELAREEVV